MVKRTDDDFLFFLAYTGYGQAETDETIAKLKAAFEAGRGIQPKSWKSVTISPVPSLPVTTTIAPNSAWTISTAKSDWTKDCSG